MNKLQPGSASAAQSQREYIFDQEQVSAKMSGAAMMIGFKPRASAAIAKAAPSA
jgi:hypothetical protein